MAETQPMDLQELCYTASEDRQALNALVCVPGVAVQATDLKVTTTGAADNSVNVASGQAFIQGTTSLVADPDVGMYLVRNDATETVGPFSANGSGNPRIDMVVARVRDSEYVPGNDDWLLEIVEGTPTAGAQVSDPTAANYHAGIGTLGETSYVLAYVLRANGTTTGSTISAGDIEDARTGYGRCGTFPYIELEATAATALGTAVATKINLATVVHIDPEAFTLSASVVTIVASGWYDVSGWALITSATGDTKIVSLIRSVAPTTIASAGGANLATVYGSPSADQVFLAAGTTVQLQGFATTAATSTFHDANNKSRLVIRKVG